MATASPIVVVNLIAMPFSGGTWVNLLLGAHDEMCSIGEIDLINRGGIPICSLCGLNCSLWCSYRTGTNENIFHQLRRISGRRILVLSNSRQFLDHQMHPGIESKFIWVLRDGRGSVAGTLRRFPGRSAWRASRGWVRRMGQARRFLDRQPRQSVLHVSYEALASRDVAELLRMCEFIGTRPDPAAFDHWIDEPHLLGGNPATLAHLQHRHDSTSYYVVTRDGRFVEQDLEEADVAAARAAAEAAGDDGVPRFDPHRWRSELSSFQRSLFALAAGRLNRRVVHVHAPAQSTNSAAVQPRDPEAPAPSQVPS